MTGSGQAISMVLSPLFCTLSLLRQRGQDRVNVATTHGRAPY